MSYSSCLSDEDTELVLDSSVAINLMATGQSAAILRALPMPIVVTDYVVREIEFGAAVGRPESGQLNRLIGDRCVRVAELEGQALEIFLDLVSGDATESLGDGEASSLALALIQGSTAAIDEKKATRIATDRFGSLRLATTVDILAHGSVLEVLGESILADATFQALRVARMQVRELQFDWVAGLIGQDRVESCSSLRRLTRRIRNS